MTTWIIAGMKFFSCPKRTAIYLIFLVTLKSKIYMNSQYEVFEDFIFRCPIFPLNSNISSAQFEILKEAISLSSKDLFKEMVKPDKDFNPKAKLSLLKYQIRMKSRCTPFGLFSGSGMGKIAKKSEIILNSINSYKSHTRLDMDFLHTLSLHISKIEATVNSLYYYPNSSLYKIHNSYRYIEYKYETGRRKYTISEIENDKYLETALKVCKNGAKKSKLIESFIPGEFDEKEISEYINSLIDNQIVVSSLEPSVTGDDLFTNIISFINEVDIIPEIKEILLKIKTQLSDLDNITIGRSETLYANIEKDIHFLNIEYQKNNLFQSDMLVTPQSATLSNKIIETIKEGITILNKLSPNKRSNSLAKFKEDFYKRYGEEEISLTEALDPDIGIDFLDIASRNTDYPLIENIFNDKRDENDKTNLSAVEILLLEKYYQTLKEQKQILALTDKELETFPPTWDDLPTTFSSVIEIIEPDINNSAPLIVLKSTGGTSAANLITRFCHINNEIKNHVKNIIKKEEEITGDTKIIAEIIHLPESRTGNILFRPAIRKYEIPYLAKASVRKEFQIPITDLMISVRGGKSIHLRSKMLEKEIIPRLTAAHNFTSSSLPIYQFLCLFQTFEVRDSITFKWGTFLRKKKYLPRVAYKNIILCPAMWNFDQKDFSEIPPVGDKMFLENVSKFKQENKIPDLVLLVKSDTKLLIDFNNEASINLLFSEIKNQNFLLEEFIFDFEKPFIKAGEQIYRNEVILGFYKSDI